MHPRANGVIKKWINSGNGIYLGPVPERPDQSKKAGTVANGMNDMRIDGLVAIFGNKSNNMHSDANQQE